MEPRELDSNVEIGKERAVSLTDDGGKIGYTVTR